MYELSFRNREISIFLKIDISLFLKTKLLYKLVNFIMEGNHDECREYP